MLTCDSGQVSVDTGAQFYCTSAFTFFGLNEIPYARVLIAPAPEEADAVFPKTYPALYSQLKSLKQGETNATVYMRLNGTPPVTGEGDFQNTNVAVFSGIFQNFGTTMVGGRLYVVMWIAHSMITLNQIPAIVDTIHGRSLSDNAVASTAGETADKEALVPYGLSTYKDDDVKKDLWGKIIQKELGKLMSFKSFGTVRAQKVADLFKGENFLNKDLALPLTFENCDDPKSVIADIRKTIYKTEGQDRTIWDKMLRLASRYKFFIVPRVADFLIEPGIYTLGMNSTNLGFDYSQFSTFHEYTMKDMSQISVATPFEDASAYTSMFDPQAKKQFTTDTSTYPKGSAGLKKYIVQFKAPPWVYSYDMLSQYSAQTLGLAAQQLFSAGCVTRPVANPEKTLNQHRNTIKGIGMQAFSDTELSEQLFKDRTAILRGPLMWDLSPGSSLMFEHPLSYAGGSPNNDSRAIGCIRRMCIAYDPVFKQMGTWIIASHVHTTEEHKRIPWQKHPMYNQRFLRAPLLDLSKEKLVAEAELK